MNNLRLILKKWQTKEMHERRSCILNDYFIKEFGFVPKDPRILPTYARRYGMTVSPMIWFCESYDYNDKLPRGMDKKIEMLRPVMEKFLENEKRRILSGCGSV